jgi:hypothetical protein
MPTGSARTSLTKPLGGARRPLSAAGRVVLQAPLSCTSQAESRWLSSGHVSGGSGLWGSGAGCDIRHLASLFRWPLRDTLDTPRVRRDLRPDSATLHGAAARRLTAGDEVVAPSSTRGCQPGLPPAPDSPRLSSSMRSPTRQRRVKCVLSRPCVSPAQELLDTNRPEWDRCRSNDQPLRKGRPC